MFNISRSDRVQKTKSSTSYHLSLGTSLVAIPTFDHAVIIFDGSRQIVRYNRRHTLCWTGRKRKKIKKKKKEIRKKKKLSYGLCQVSWIRL
jgi:hypothetical protein